MDVHLYHSHLFIVNIYIYIYGMAIMEGITAHIDFSYIHYLDNIQKNSYCKFQ